MSGTCRQRIKGEFKTRYRQCRRKATHDGYCAQHHPPAITARLLARLGAHDAARARRELAHRAAMETRGALERLAGAVRDLRRARRMVAAEESSSTRAGLGAWRGQEHQAFARLFRTLDEYDALNDAASAVGAERRPC